MKRATQRIRHLQGKSPNIGGKSHELGTFEWLTGGPNVTGKFFKNGQFYGTRHTYKSQRF